LQSFRASKAELVISDRSLFDLYLYTHSLEGRLRPLYIEMLHELVFAEAAQVDVYAYVPIEFEMIVDEVRPADLAYQSAIDADVVRLLQHFSLKTITVRGSLSERTETLIEHLYA
jgi:hypothetical protein